MCKRLWWAHLYILFKKSWLGQGLTQSIRFWSQIGLGKNDLGLKFYQPTSNFFIRLIMLSEFSYALHFFTFMVSNYQKLGSIPKLESNKKIQKNRGPDQHSLLSWPIKWVSFQLKLKLGCRFTFFFYYKTFNVQKMRLVWSY